MFHYQKDIDAWRRFTRRLSAAEKGIYGELLDELYTTESPLPIDPEELYRIAGITKPDERKAVDKVISRFFELTPAGYIQARALEEIEAYHAGAEKNRNNGKKGGRPPKIKTEEKPKPEPSENPVGLFSVPENPENQNPNERQSGNPVIQSISVENLSHDDVVISPNDARQRILSASQNPSPPSGLASIAPDWQPNAEVTEALTSLHRVSPEFIAAQVIEFRTYWRDRGLPVASWNAKFLQRCVSQWKRDAVENVKLSEEIRHAERKHTRADHAIDVTDATYDYDRATQF